MVGLVAMVVSMPLMAPAGHEGMAGSSDPFMRWASVAGARCAARDAVALLDRYGVLSFALLAATAAIMAWAGAISTPCLVGAAKSADMNTLVAVGTGAAFVFSAVATVAPSVFLAGGVAPDTYYEAVIFIIALILVGNTLEAREASDGAAARARRTATRDARIEQDGVEVPCRQGR
jgi:Cu+-exporting ATPase